MLPDLIWFKWQEGEIDPVLGERGIDLKTPPGWHQIINGNPEPLLKLTAVVEVVGLVLQMNGKARHHFLVDASSEKTERFRLDVDFNSLRLHNRRLTLRRFFTERKLQAWIEKRGGTRMIIRVQLPRLQYLNQYYYPLSERAARIVLNQMLAYEAGQLSEFPIFIFNEIEGTELKTALEPIYQGHYHLWRRASQEKVAEQ